MLACLYGNRRYVVQTTYMVKYFAPQLVNWHRIYSLHLIIQNDVTSKMRIFPKQSVKTNNQWNETLEPSLRGLRNIQNKQKNGKMDPSQTSGGFQEVFCKSKNTQNKIAKWIVKVSQQMLRTECRLLDLLAVKPQFSSSLLQIFGNNWPQLHWMCQRDENES